MKNKSKNIYLILCAFSAFFLFGLIDNLKGVTMPLILDEFDFNYSQGGIIFSGLSLGYLAAMLIAGTICDRFGNLMVIRAGGLLVLTGIALYSFATLIFIFYIAMLIVGFGFAFLLIGSNSLVADLYRDNQKLGKYLMLLGFFGSLGAAASPAIAGELINLKIDWREVYHIAFMLLAIFVIYFFILKMPVVNSGQGAKRDFLNLMWRITISDRMPLFCIISFSYAGIEVGMASWVVEYLQKVKLHSAYESSFMLSIFFFGIMVGRLIGSTIIERIGYLKIMLLAIVMSAVSLLIMVSGDAWLGIYIAVSGLFLSVIFPTITGCVAKISETNVGVRLGILYTCGGIGGIACPVLIGKVSDIVSLRFAFDVFLMLFHLVIILCLVKLFFQKNRKSSQVTAG